MSHSRHLGRWVNFHFRSWSEPYLETTRFDSRWNRSHETTATNAEESRIRGQLPNQTDRAERWTGDGKDSGKSWETNKPSGGREWVDQLHWHFSKQRISYRNGTIWKRCRRPINAFARTRNCGDASMSRWRSSRWRTRLQYQPNWSIHEMFDCGRCNKQTVA